MKLLMVLMALMSFIIENKNSVSMDGTWPYDIEVNYANTGSKGSVTAGQTATLSLSHLDGITIDQVVVYVKSNKSSGAGTFTLSLNGQPAVTKSGTFKEWTGSWDNTNYHPIVLQSQALNDIHSLEIRLEGTANSLHICQYDISWSPRPAHTVTFMRGGTTFTSMAEESGMQGVLLPSVPDSAEWKFRGWSTREFWTIHECPVLMAAGETYFPETDCTLWAAFEYVADEPESIYATTLGDGDFRYMNSYNNLALTGVPMNGIMASEPLNLTDEAQIYSIAFIDSTAATITHKSSGTPIGYSGTQLASIASEWKCYHVGEETVFYMEKNGDKYVLWLNITDGSGENRHAGLIKAASFNSPLRLMPVREQSEMAFTCHPEVPMGIEQTPVEHSNAPNECLLMRLGNCELILLNGQKQIRITQ